MDRIATIVAVATGPAPGAIGIVRVSGPDAFEVALPLAPSVPFPPEPRRAYVSRLVDRAGAPLDEGMVLAFEAGGSATGERVVELHAHGSPALLALLEQEILADARVRPARPGEFTRRAFENGRIDLLHAEAVADLVASQSEAAVRNAAAQLSGGLSSAVDAIRRPLVEARAELEGALDFPDEAEDASLEAGPAIASAQARLEALRASARVGRLVAQGSRVVLVGPVNSGKSTLFNRLLGEERALVDAEPGTTRDVLEARCELGGMPVVLVDTAGLREGAGRLEQLGIDRARAAIEGADLVLDVLPAGSGVPRTAAPGRLQLASKVDAVGVFHVEPGVLPVSGRTGAGLAELREAVGGRLRSGAGCSPLREASGRHARALAVAAEALARAQAACTAGTLEAVSGELSEALEALEGLSGTAASQELLDAVFRRFCIGK